MGEGTSIITDLFEKPSKSFKRFELVTVLNSWTHLWTWKFCSCSKLKLHNSHWKRNLELFSCGENCVSFLFVCNSRLVMGSGSGFFFNSSMSLPVPGPRTQMPSKRFTSLSTSSSLGSSDSMREGTVVCKIVHKIASVWCKTASGEVGVSLPWWCAALVLLAPGYWSLFLNLKNWFIMEKWSLVIFP